MPEGPEIRRAADRVAAVLVGRAIRKVEFGLPQLRRFEKALKGRVVTAVDTHGKAMLTHFDNGLSIYSHNQLYGRWYTVRGSRMPETRRQLRIALQTESHKALLYSASEIEVLDKAELAVHPYLTSVGPDILDDSLCAADVVDRLCEPRFRRRALGSLYLDQRFLAGNGNYLRSEILWAAGLDATRTPGTLPRRELATLARETLRIARRSYRTRGVTVTGSLAASLRAAGLTYGEYRFYAFGRTGLPCHRCGAPIEQRRMSGRNLFFCPSCQSAT